MRRSVRTALVVGFEYHVGVFCRKMNAHAAGWRFLPVPASRTGLLRAALSLRTAAALISFSGPGPHPLLLATARAFNVPIFVIWAGTDVVRVASQPSSLSHWQRAELHHLAIAPWFTDELRGAGIESRYLPILGVTPNPAELPRDKFRVLTYLPEPRRDFYGRRHVYEVAKRLPQVKFLVVGAGGSDPTAPANVEFRGWVQNVEALMESSTVLLRVPDHDGMSLIVLEALARGRHVIWKYALPGVRQVTSIDDTVRHLSELYTLHVGGRLHVNTEGVEYVRNSYDETHVSQALEAFFDREVVQPDFSKGHRRQVAISGLDMFVTDVATLNNALATNWTAKVLQPNSKYESAAAFYALARCDVWYTVGALSFGPYMTRLADLLKKPRVMHWVGSDIEVLRRNPRLLEALRRPSVSHLTEVDWEASELRELGLNPEIAPLPPRIVSPSVLPPLPKDFTILTYLPNSRPDFYGRRDLEAVMDRLRNLPIRYLVVGGAEVDPPAGVRVENRGWRFGLEDVYAESSALLRFTPRDGLSLMVLEALSFGRHVLWTKTFPFVRTVLTVNDICNAVQDLFGLQESVGLQLQADAAMFIRTVYDRERCIQRIASAWDRAVARSEATGAAESARGL